MPRRKRERPAPPSEGMRAALLGSDLSPTALEPWAHLVAFARAVDPDDPSAPAAPAALTFATVSLLAERLLDASPAGPPLPGDPPNVVGTVTPARAVAALLAGAARRAAEAVANHADPDAILRAGFRVGRLARRLESLLEDKATRDGFRRLRGLSRANRERGSETIHNYPALVASVRGHIHEGVKRSEAIRRAAREAGCSRSTIERALRESRGRKTK